MGLRELAVQGMAVNQLFEKLEETKKDLELLEKEQEKQAENKETCRKALRANAAAEKEKWFSNASRAYRETASKAEKQEKEIEENAQLLEKKQDAQKKAAEGADSERRRPAGWYFGRGKGTSQISASCRSGSRVEGAEAAKRGKRSLI